MTAVKVKAVEGEVGIVLPRELLETLHVSEGDTLYAIETANGIQLVSADAELQQQMGIAESVMQENKKVLRRLAE